MFSEQCGHYRVSGDDLRQPVVLAQRHTEVTIWITLETAPKAQIFATHASKIKEKRRQLI